MNEYVKQQQESEDRKRKLIPNVPYVKQYDAAGNLINPIEGEYRSTGPNRRMRRANRKVINKFISNLKKRKKRK